VIENFEVEALLTSLPVGHPLLGSVAGAQRCAAGSAWQWDGVRFAILHPEGAAARAKKSNDLSCVLKVSAGARSMLLTGDIEKPAEAELLKRDATALLERGLPTLAADVLLVPHHGSRTSSTAEFLAAVGARTAVLPVGYRNRFGHPNADVLQRLGSTIYRTDYDGAVTVRFSQDVFDIGGERQERRRYWHDAPR
jgi:competence protein ComEC